MYFDAVAYGSEELGFVSDTIARSAAYTGIGGAHKELLGTYSRSEGSSRMLFGTDHPFFPPLNEEEKWMSVVENLEAIEGVRGWSNEDKDRVRGENAVNLFGLD